MSSHDQIDRLAVQEVTGILDGAGVDQSRLVILDDSTVWRDVETGHAATSVVIMGPAGDRDAATSALMASGLAHAPYGNYDAWSRRRPPERDADREAGS